MNDGQTPPPVGSQKKSMTERLNSNGARMVAAFWKIINGLVLAGIVGLLAILWGIHGRLSVIEATMVTDAELAESLSELPPADYRELVGNRFDEMGRRLDQLEPTRQDE